MVLGGEASGPGHPSHSTRNWQSLDLRHVHLNPDIKLLKKSQLIYNVLISIVQQNDSVIYIYTHILFHCSLSQAVEYSAVCSNSKTLFIHSIDNS